MSQPEPLTPEDEEELYELRSRVVRYMREEDVLRYGQIGYKLTVLKTLLENGVHDPETLRGMGAVFGDAFITTFELEWVKVHGEFALHKRGTGFTMYPLPLIGPGVDVYELFGLLAGGLEELES